MFNHLMIKYLAKAHKIKTITLLISMVFFLVPQNAMASPQTVFSISPSTCVVNLSGDACNKPLQINWKTPVIANYCLYGNKQRIKCWQSKQRVSETLVFKIRDSTIFELINEHNQVIAHTKVSVKSATSKRFRRRLRADWSVF
ncbi:DUF3019 domain-containing protein [Psychrobium sp. nBUS_13]|uniref:DUF3019 domain-containing protein n=1 Tax=Psychrobium sp. nBUS_13 TaxID=3395319 RepID=UPI003EBA8A5A